MDFKGLIVSVSFLFASAAYSNTYQFEKKEGITWKGSKVIGGSHKGQLTIKDGSITLKNNLPVSATLTVDMKSITNTDLKNEEMNKKLVGHLHSKEFFHTEEFPEAKVNITSLKKIKKGSYQLEGLLEIKGKTKKVNFPAEFIVEKGKLKSIKTKLSFDRTKFDIRYGSGKFFSNLGDKMISDKVELDIELILAKPASLAAH